jgi:DNA-binding Lrp family transcriptional regulator
MLKLDLKDRKILYHLDLNSRQTYSQIGKKVGLPKKSIQKRIKTLEEMGIIQSYYTVIDVYKLGYILMRFQYKYQYTTPEKEKEIIEHFIKDKYATLVASAHGMYNLKVIRVIKDMSDFYEFWQETQKNFGYYFQERASSLFITELYYEPSYLLGKYYEKKRERFTLLGRGKKIEIDEIEFKILKLISENARLKISEIAEKIGLDIKYIDDKLKKLIKMHVIRGFRTNIDISKLGFRIFRVNLFLKDFLQRNDIINFVKVHQNLVFIDTYTSEADLELEFHLEDINQFTEIMQNITTKFPDAIKNYKYLNIIKNHKYIYFPPE